ncbi:MAG: hypothetical protein JWR59_1628, partial [Brevundimonas sp.]|nr:hypothetical protein [Brevundimonas sp.]
PERYGALLDEQVRWFRTLTGRKPQLVRNHGFLNDGYWGHLPHWRRNGIWGSSNLPGFVGRVLNGSLLPARMAYDGLLTEHWSLLTAIGDGVRFAGGHTDEESAQIVRDTADQVLASGTPGVLALNLHPQNVSETRAMHVMVKRLAAEGFQAWNLGQCLAWFEAKETASKTSGFWVTARSALARLGKNPRWNP